MQPHADGTRCAAGYVEREMPHNVDGNALSFDPVTTGEKDDGAKAGPFRDATCVICEARPSTRRGEHVWPQWYLRAHIHPPGPYEWSFNDDPILRSDGTPLAPDVLMRVKLPVCGQCNAELNSRFERASDVMLRVFGVSGRLALSANDAELVGLWLLKTWLLLSHPQVLYSEPVIDGLDIIRDRRALPQRCYRWLVTGESPPDGLSMWITRTTDDGPARRSGPIIPVPEVHADGEQVSFETHEVTLHGLTVVVVFHPGWPIFHSHEAEGRAVRMWPTPGAVDLGALGSVPLSQVPRWSEGWRVVLKDGVLGSGDLPPLGSSNVPFPLNLGKSVLSAARLSRR